MATGADQFLEGFEFDTTDIQAVIRAAMHMGLPEDETLRPRFFFDEGPTFTGPQSVNGKPFNRATAAATVPDPYAGELILCSYEEREGESDETTVGTFEAKEYIVTFLAEEWEQAKDFTYVRLGGKLYKRSYPIAPVGLHDAGVFQVRVEAGDL